MVRIDWSEKSFNIKYLYKPICLGNLQTNIKIWDIAGYQTILETIIHPKDQTKILRSSVLLVHALSGCELYNSTYNFYKKRKLLLYNLLKKEMKFRCCALIFNSPKRTLQTNLTQVNRFYFVFAVYGVI